MLICDNEIEEFKEIVEAFNVSLGKLQSYSVPTLPICFDKPGTTATHCASSFEYNCHCFLRRVLNLAQEYASAFNRKELLSAALIGRAMVETIAHFHMLIHEVERLLTKKEYARVYHLIASFALGGRHEITESIELKSLHILDSIRLLDKNTGVAMRVYEWLSEFSHPNSFGTSVSFSRFNKESGQIELNERPKGQSFVSPALEPALLLPAMEWDWEKVATLKALILAEWQTSPEVFEIFQPDKE